MEAKGVKCITTLHSVEFTEMDSHTFLKFRETNVLTIEVGKDKNSRNIFGKIECSVFSHYSMLLGD